VGNGLVRNEAGYQAFNTLEEAEFRDVKGKPKQPVTSLSGLVECSVEAMPRFDELMSGVEQEANLGDAELDVSPGGVEWGVGPLKRAGRVVEKLVLDPAGREALDSADPTALDASGICDTVRGMFLCNTMAHAHLVLLCLARRYGSAGSEKETVCCFKRSKNRYATPSDGGWMDCMVNLAVWIEERKVWFVCEVQIVHLQLLTVRAELGAHHVYGEYRGAQEMLESEGCGELSSGDVLVVRRFVVRVVFSALLGPDGQPLLSSEEAADEAKLDALAAKQKWCLSRVGGGRPWPRLLDLSLDGRQVASVATSGVAHQPVVVDTLRGLRGVTAEGCGGYRGCEIARLLRVCSETH